MLTSIIYAINFTVTVSLHIHCQRYQQGSGTVFSDLGKGLQKYM